jgi:hypothetical protein
VGKTFPDELWEEFGRLTTWQGPFTGLSGFGLSGSCCRSMIRSLRHEADTDLTSAASTPAS